MRTCLLFLILALPLVLLAAANSASDAIIGTWLTAGGTSQVSVYKEGNQYLGKIIWLKEPLDEKGKARLDVKNPKTDLRNRPLKDLVILHDLKFMGDNSWSKGNIYDPKSGNTYKCNIRLKNNNNVMVLRGFIGVSLLGRDEEWKRIK